MDPLKPLTSAILAMSPSTSRRTQKAELTPARRAQTLHDRLRSRMATLPQWTAAQARQVFVESVLMAELGEQLATDPAFSALVQRVSQQLDSDAKLSARLDVLLKRVAAGEAIA